MMPIHFINKDRATLNLRKKELSDLSYEIISFPDGEKQLNITSPLINCKKVVVIFTTIKSADDLFILLQAQDILERYNIQYCTIITYLMTQRSDRVFSEGRPFSIGIVMKLLHGIVEVFELHNTTAKGLATNAEYFNNIGLLMSTRGMSENNISYKPYLYLFPDKGAFDRYGYFRIPDSKILIGKKVRDVSTGQITDYTITDIDDEKPRIPKNTKKIYVIDDLCDGGRTFIGAASKLRELAPNAKICLNVIHVVQEEGLRRVCEEFDEVTVTNSYADWEKLDIPNLKVIDIVNIKDPLLNMPI